MANSFPTPSEEEIAVVDKLYNQLLFDTECEHNIVDLVDSSYQLTKTTVLRFYRGRKSVEETCLKAVRRHIQWRNENDVDHINDKLHLFKTELDSGEGDRPACSVNGWSSCYVSDYSMATSLLLLC